MNIPAYYCPRCKRFKRWFQVTNVDACDYGNCKYCGAECVEVKGAILDYLNKHYGEVQYPTFDPKMNKEEKENV